jgi:hypothetical protein
MSDDSPPDTGPLTAGAAQVAKGYLRDIRADLEDALQVFDSDVQTAVQDLKVESKSDLGASFFKIAESVVVNAIPAGQKFEELVEAGKEVLKGFVDKIADHIKDADRETAAGQEAWAKDELLRRAKKLKEGALAGAREFVEGTSESTLQHVAEKVLEAHPDMKDLDGTDSGNHEAIARRMVGDPRNSPLKAELSAQLQAGLKEELEAVKTGVDWLQMEGFPGGDYLRLRYLCEQHQKHGTDLYQLVVELGGHADYWDPYIRIYYMAGQDRALEAMEVHITSGVVPNPEDYRP